MLKKLDFDQLGETLYTEVLANGLRVYYLPKPDFHKTYGIFTTNFGSLDISFNGKTYPEGIAHFLEHKLFEKKDGDAMYKFGALGAQTNAFTSFNRTAYLFYTRENIEKSTSLLLDFVQEPYFTAENVAKEQGIITQEIQMYQDDPDWRLFSGLLASMYPGSPLDKDIAGTPATIEQITDEMLDENYAAFYHPANMNLFLTGPFQLDEMARLVKDNQAKKTFSPFKKPEILPFNPSPSLDHEEIQMEVAMPKLGLGLRGNEPLPSGRDLYIYRLALQIFLQMIFGKTSHYHDSLYQAGLIDESFSYELELDPRFHLIVFSGDSQEVKRLAESLKSRLKNYKMVREQDRSSDFTQDHFDLIKRQALGSFYKSLNSLEVVANEFSTNLYGEDVTLFEFPQILSELSMDHMVQIVDRFLASMSLTEFVILPK